MLSEIQNTEALVDTNLIVNNKMTLLEHLSSNEIKEEKVEADEGTVKKAKKLTKRPQNEQP